MMEPEIVKNRGLSRVSDGKVKGDWATLGPRVRWTDLEILQISGHASAPLTAYKLPLAAAGASAAAARVVDLGAPDASVGGA